jgi:hypothetical protein
MALGKSFGGRPGIVGPMLCPWTEADEAEEGLARTPKSAKKKKEKQKKLPPLQPAFAELVDDLKQAVEDASINKLSSLVSILSELTKVDTRCRRIHY